MGEFLSVQITRMRGHFARTFCFDAVLILFSFYFPINTAKLQKDRAQVLASFIFIGNQELCFTHDVM